MYDNSDWYWQFLLYTPINGLENLNQQMLYFIVSVDSKR